MIDKIDRPDRTTPYRVEETANATDDQGGDQQQEQHEDEFSEPGLAHKWGQFHGKIKNRRLIKLQTNQIEKVLFKQVRLQGQFVLLEADVNVKSGTPIKNAVFLIPQLESYIKLKSRKPGEKIPMDQITDHKQVEISVAEQTNTKQWPSPQQAQAAPVKHRKGLNLKRIILFSIIGIGIFIYLLLLIGK